MMPSRDFWLQLQLPQPWKHPSRFLRGCEQVTSNQRPSPHLSTSLKVFTFWAFLRLQFPPSALLSVISPSEEWAHSVWRTEIERVLGRSQKTQSFNGWQQCRGETIDAGRVCWLAAVNIGIDAEIKTRYVRLIRICQWTVVLHLFGGDLPAITQAFPVNSAELWARSQAH